MTLLEFDQIPQELKPIKQWVCWSYGKQKPDGRYDKYPIEPFSGARLEWSKKENWHTFTEAKELWLLNQGKIKGIGFVFTKEDPYCGVDLDSCLVDGKLSAIAAERVRLLSSYTEISVSGTGVHVIVKSEQEKAIPAGDHSFGIEVYPHGRFFTFTGKHFTGTPLSITNCDMYLSALYEQYEDHLKATVKIGKGSRTNKIFSTAGRLRNLGLDAKRIDPILQEINQEMNNPPLPTAKIKKMAERVEQQYLPGHDPRDISNANLFVELEGREKFRWVVPWKAWLIWQGNFWKQDFEESLRLACESVSQELMRRAVSLAQQDAKDAKKAFSWALESGSLSRINAIDRVSRPRLIAPVDKLDANPNLFACSNGIVDLSTGKLRPGVREDWITRSTAIAFRPEAKCPQFDKFLDEIMQGEKQMIEYLWRVVGYCLTGSTKERAFFIFYGHGRNGKTTFLEVIKAMLGQYSQSARASMILEKNQVQTGANDDVARTASARLVEITELSGRSTLDAAAVTALTGSDRISARMLNANLFEFKPAFKLFIVTNHIPKINDSSEAIWHRLHKVPFEYKVPDDKVDKDLTDKLLGEIEGVLAKSVISCLEWQKIGLKPPDKVIKSGEDLREEMDVLGQALTEILDPDSSKNERTPQAEIYKEFKLWTERNGMKRDRTTSRQLTEYMKVRGYKHIVGAHNRTTWINARLRDKFETSHSSWDSGMLTQEEPGEIEI